MTDTTLQAQATDAATTIPDTRIGILLLAMRDRIDALERENAALRDNPARVREALELAEGKEWRRKMLGEINALSLHNATLRAELAGVREALSTVASLPIPEQDDMPSANMRLIAKRALTSTFRPTHRHVKCGTEYAVIGTAELQAAECHAIEGDTLVIYQGSDGKWWARERGMFDDGRFVPIAQDTAHIQPDPTLRRDAFAEALRRYPTDVEGALIFFVSATGAPGRLTGEDIEWAKAECERLDLLTPDPAP